MCMNKKYGFVYILTNTYNTVLYVGVTSNLSKRIYEHKNKLVDGFSKKYNLDKLVYYQISESMESAIKYEKYLKGKSREFKINLIEKMNPEWDDLYDSIA